MKRNKNILLKALNDDIVGLREAFDAQFGEWLEKAANILEGSDIDSEGELIDEADVFSKIEKMPDHDEDPEKIEIEPDGDIEKRG